MSYRPMVSTGGEFDGNALRFATREEAEASAQDLASRWFLVVDWRVDESNDPVNYAIVDGRAVPVREVASVPVG